MDPEIVDIDEKKKYQFNSQKIIQMMKITKKTDPLFKPLKKLKNALQSIGYQIISSTVTKNIILFHFGLGNDFDFQLIKLTHPPEYMNEKNVILPGKSYCYLKFNQLSEAQNYINKNYLPIIQNINAKYLNIVHNNTSRTFICLYAKQQNVQQISGLSSLANAQLHYQEGLIPGIVLIQQFISKQEQNQLLTEIDSHQWIKLNNRRVQHYGYEFKYGRNQIDRDELYAHEMPKFIQKIMVKLKSIQNLKEYQFDQMTINDYFAGDGIPAHFDTHSPFQEHFIAISILSGIVMEWRKYDGTEKDVYLPARSLIIFGGEGRYAWTHGISCRKFDKIEGQLKYRSRRISITLRKIKYTPCKCNYYFYCDSQGYDQSKMKKHNQLLLKFLSQQKKQKLQSRSSQKIYQQFVIKAYNGFGFDFHNKSIGQVQQIIQKLFNDASNNLHEFLNILDVGCGNGEYLDYLQRKKYQNYHYIGIQICDKMAQFDDKIIMDGLKLGFRQSLFDIVLCIAVLHHMTSQQQRLKLLKQLKKVVKTNGYILLTVFGYEQKSNIYANQDILLDYCVSKQKLQRKQQNNHNQMKQNVRIQKRGEVYQRYYHLFKKQQLVDLLNSLQLKIQIYKQDKQNLICLVKKL